MRDREREHRAERVHPAEEVDLAREDEDRRADGAEHDQRQHRRLQLRMQPAEHLGELPVARHRVGDPRRADHARVRRDEEDRRREDADVDLRRREQVAVQAEVLDQPEHGVVLEAERRALAQLGHVMPADVDDGHRRERDPRQREVDREDGDRDPGDRARDRADRVPRLLGQVGDRLDPGVGDHRHRDREQEARPRSALRRDGCSRAARADGRSGRSRARRAGAASRSRSPPGRC